MLAISTLQHLHYRSTTVHREVKREHKHLQTFFVVRVHVLKTVYTLYIRDWIEDITAPCLSAVVISIFFISEIH